MKTIWTILFIAGSSALIVAIMIDAFELAQRLAWLVIALDALALIALLFAKDSEKAEHELP